MKDRAGNELTVGDKVLYLVAGTSNSRLEWGVVDSFTPKKVRINPDRKSVLHDTVLREPGSVVKPFREPCIHDCGYRHDE